jgi:hypothetical protein
MCGKESSIAKQAAVYLPAPASRPECAARLELVKRRREQQEENDEEQLMHP